MTSSLIITTYNWKEALELVLNSALKQSVPLDEIIIADDGSRVDTKKLIEKYMEDSNIQIIHSWQEDKGFRAAKSRNLAIAKASSEYIIVIDGDMILHKDFVRDHKNHAQKSFFLQGGRVLLGKNFTQELFTNKSFSISFFDKDIINRKNTIHSNILSTLFLKQSTVLKGIKTCNMSFYKLDCVSVNGFNEEFIGWGREDSEYVVRLYNKNIKRKNIKFNAIAYHLHHNENARVSLPLNDELLKNTISHKLDYCQNGIKKYL